jgi:uncharacterized protein YebE (UPF0316 family)
VWFDNPLLVAALILVIRVFSITISTIRYLVMGRANDVLVSALAFLEALTFAITFGAVSQNLRNLWNLFAYSLGFAIGTWVGMLIEQRVYTSHATINIVSMGHSLPIAQAIRAAGFGATRSAGEGERGAVGIVRTVVRRQDAARITDIAQDIDPRSFITVEDVRRVARGFLGYGRS